MIADFHASQARARTAPVQRMTAKNNPNAQRKGAMRKMANVPPASMRVVNAAKTNAQILMSFCSTVVNVEETRETANVKG